MKDTSHKLLPREQSEIIVSSAQTERRPTTTAHRVPGHHRKVEALRIEPVVEFHRSSSGRNLRLKHVSATTSASLLASPQRLTPHAPDRKRSYEQTPPPGSPSVPDVPEKTETQSSSPSPIDNQQLSNRKPTRSKSTDRRSSFSISAHVLQELGFIRSKTPELEQIGQNQRLDEAPGQESPVPSPPPPLPLGQIVEEPSFPSPQPPPPSNAPTEEGNRPVYQFDLWKRAAKTRTLCDAITIPSNTQNDSPPKPRTSRSRRGSYEGEYRWLRSNEGITNDLQRLHLPSTSLQRSQSTNGVPASVFNPSSRASMSRSTSEPPQEVEELSLTRSTSPTIGRSNSTSSSSSITTSTTTTTAGSYHVPPVQTEGDTDVLRWRKVELIGEGTFGKVYKTFNADTGKFFALKEIEIRSTASILQIKQVQKLGEEISVMRNLSHQHIVRYTGSYRTDHHFCIVMEYVPGGSIASMLKQSGAFREELVRKFTLQIVKGVVYLHRMGIIHRDIKGANVLVNDQGVLKLADFGCSKQLPQLITTSLEESLRSIRGSVPWMAPEVVRQTGHGFKADIWSIGATVIEMATGTHPWPSSTNSLAAMYAIATATTSPPLPRGLSSDARSFLRRCFCIDPEERASAAELEQHAFLRY